MAYNTFVFDVITWSGEHSVNVLGQEIGDNMRLCHDHCIAILELTGNTCSDCMATVDGPFPEDTMRAQDVDLLIVNELETAEYYCKFTYHSNDNMYSIRTDIDILNVKERRPEREQLRLKDPSTHTPTDYNFSITNSLWNETSNVAIYKTQIVFLLINEDTPTLVARCVIEIPATRQSCSSSSTFAIIPNITSEIDPDLPTAVTGASGVTPEKFAPVIALLGLVVLIETILLSICTTVVYRNSRNRVFPLTLNRDNNVAGSGASNPRTMMTHDVQASADSDSAVGTVSELTISGDINIAQ